MPVYGSVLIGSVAPAFAYLCWLPSARKATRSGEDDFSVLVKIMGVGSVIGVALGAVLLVVALLS
jgi:hypothetical protein